MRFNLDKHFGIHAQSVSVRGERAKLLASNLANSDTPNYKARDIDFKALLQQSNTLQSTRLVSTHQNHLNTQGQSFSQAEVLYRNPAQPSLDGNTVDSQIEKSLFAENSVHYQDSLQFLSGRITGLMSALKGD